MYVCTKIEKIMKENTKGEHVMPASLPQRRVNPLKALEPEEEIKDLPAQQEEVEEVEIVEKPKPRKVVKQARIVRVKYTATMDSNLRKRLRIAAVNQELDISEYIEMAVREKLEREGD